VAESSTDDAAGMLALLRASTQQPEFTIEYHRPPDGRTGTVADWNIRVVDAPLADFFVVTFGLGNGTYTITDPSWRPKEEWHRVNVTSGEEVEPKVTELLDSLDTLARRGFLDIASPRPFELALLAPLDAYDPISVDEHDTEDEAVADGGTASALHFGRPPVAMNWTLPGLVDYILTELVDRSDVGLIKIAAGGDEPLFVEHYFANWRFAIGMPVVMEFDPGVFTVHRSVSLTVYNLPPDDRRVGQARLTDDAARRGAELLDQALVARNRGELVGSITIDWDLLGEEAASVEEAVDMLEGWIPAAPFRVFFSRETGDPRGAAAVRQLASIGKMRRIADVTIAAGREGKRLDWGHMFLQAAAALSIPGRRAQNFFLAYADVVSPTPETKIGPAEAFTPSIIVPRAATFTRFLTWFIESVVDVPKPGLFEVQTTGFDRPFEEHYFANWRLEIESVRPRHVCAQPPTSAVNGDGAC